MELKNSTILITGGTSGIGLEFVKQLTKQDAKIIVTGRNLDKLNEVKRQFPEIQIFQSDVSKREDIERLYKDVTHQFPELNIIINNAGIMRTISLQDISLSLENIVQEIQTNLLGVIQMNHQFITHLKTKKVSAIINVSSGLAFVPFPVSPIYSAAKAGLHSYTQVLRLQLKNTSIKVFELAPPATDTPLNDKFEDEVDKSQLMAVDKMVGIAIKGFLKDKFEIRPGLANVLKLGSRIAPNFFLNFLNKTIEKEKIKRNKLNL
ncbi:SDR family NAD(P)-dependent oxidoreductase [Chryseobacterium sp. NRRL B-14859]|uniref:SDR family oxidoreductase n=1 Tax=Chryseobacterium sp. NRRL B-14859 TaxID=1562763 RepID=UPI00339886AF